MKKYTKEELEEAIKTSLSKAEVLRKLSLEAKGGNYKILDRNIKLHNFDISHFTGQGHLKGKKHSWSPKVSMEDVLNGKVEYKTTSHLKRRLLAENYFSYKCYKCDLTEWFGFPIPLELEHIDGDNSNNRLENLTLLCPNCHALTSTYRGKNKK